MADPLVSTGWLADRLDDPSVLIVDATLPLVGQPGRGRDSYEAGHIPGAVFFGINAIADQTTELPHMLPRPEEFARIAGELGLRRDATVVVYDAHGIYSAPRVWWTLRVMGFPNAVVLDGGLKRWRGEGRPETQEVSPLPPAKLESVYHPELVRDLDAVRLLLERREAQLVDARPRSRFTGEAPEPRSGLRSGHMPGALNLPFEDLVNADGTMKSADELRKLFAHVNLSRPIVTTCGSGVTAATLALALARLGRWDVAVYDGSWTEWGGRPDTDVVTGA